MSTLELEIKGEVSVLRLQPGDIILVNADTRFPMSALEDIKVRIEGKFPGHDVVFLSGLTLSVQRDEVAA